MGVSLLEVPGERDAGLAKGFKPASQGYAVQVSSKPVDILECCQNRGTPKGWFIIEKSIEMDGWWFQIFFIFTPTWGNYPIWRAYFSNGLVQPPASIRCVLFLVPQKKVVLNRRIWRVGQSIAFSSTHSNRRISELLLEFHMDISRG